MPLQLSLIKTELKIQNENENFSTLNDADMFSIKTLLEVMC